MCRNDFWFDRLIGWLVGGGGGGETETETGFLFNVSRRVGSGPGTWNNFSNIIGINIIIIIY